MSDLDTLEYCLAYCPQSFTIDAVAQVLAVWEGEPEEDDWRWILELKNGRYAYMQGGSAYSGWDCGGSAYSVCVDTIADALRWMTRGFIDCKQNNAEVCANLRNQIVNGKKETWEAATAFKLGTVPTISPIDVHTGIEVMNYEPNLIGHAIGALVLHDADAKEPKMIMKVVDYSKKGLCKTVYLDEHNTKVWKNDIKYLHAIDRFFPELPLDLFERVQLDYLQDNWQRIRAFNRQAPVGSTIHIGTTGFKVKTPACFSEEGEAIITVSCKLRS